MSEGRDRWLAWTAFLLWVLFLFGSIVLALAAGPGTTGIGEDLGFAFIVALFPIVGILVLTRQPRNTIGWILMVIGLFWVLPFESYGHFAHSQGLPGAGLSLALSGPTWAPPIGLMGTVLLLRFPNGRLLSPRWRKVERLAILTITVVVLAIIFSPGNLKDFGYPDLANPLGIDALEPILKALTPIILLMPVTIVASAVSLIIRFRGSTGLERVQMKWLTSAGAVVASTYLLAMLASLGAEWGGRATPPWMLVVQNAAFISFGLIPIAIGVAILKYRLYDIDLVINRTLVYGLLTALLAGVYVVVAVGLGAAVRSLGQQENNAFVIAASTLAVAALFGPARRRIQAFIDRRFYRRKYDAARTLEDFSARLREQVDLDSLAGELVGVVRTTMEPTHVSLWLRSSEAPTASGVER